jgi:multidrug efflux pump subunit AcrA (membrane-fusion protein)
MITPENHPKDEKFFQSLLLYHPPRWMRILSNLLIGALVLMVLMLSLTPWQQTSRGKGQVIAFDPNDRLQNINSPVPGRVEEWFVQDGSDVKKGDPIVEIIDNDPQYMERLTLERDAAFREYDAAKSASETALLNYRRQKDLFDKGLSSRREFEKSNIEYKKLLSTEAQAAAGLAKAEVKLSRQQNQLVTAPRDGTILRVLHGAGSIMVKEGDVLASFVPKTAKPAVEIYIRGNDLPLVYPGRHVRLQFEGWPAVQFSGWPSVAVGTFGGVVSVVDSSASHGGKFRVIVVPEEGESWPDNQFLRQGTRVYGWVLLNTVKLGYELWRQFNGFPPAMEEAPDPKQQPFQQPTFEPKASKAEESS